MRYLVSVDGFIGDTFFAGSVCDQLIEQNMADEVDLEIRFPHPYFLHQANPNISMVHVGLGSAPREIYNHYQPRYNFK
jgi:hypothetical protein